LIISYLYFLDFLSFSTSFPLKFQDVSSRN